MIYVYVVRKWRVLFDADISVHATEDDANEVCNNLNNTDKPPRFYVRRAIVTLYRYE